MGRAGCWLISWGIESGNEADSEAGAQGHRSREGAAGAALGARRRASRIGATSSSDSRARPSRSARRSTSPRGCRSTSRCSTSPRRIRERRSSSRWSRTVGSGRAPGGKRWTWTRERCCNPRTSRGGPALLAATCVPRMGAAAGTSVHLSEDARVGSADVQAGRPRRPGAPRVDLGHLRTERRNRREADGEHAGRHVVGLSAR